MKRIFRKIRALGAALLVGCGLLAGLGGCGAADDGKLRIVTTVYATYDLALQMSEKTGIPCGITMLLSPGGESHAYEPSPNDVAAIQSCDLFIYIGGTSETWADKIISSSRSGKRNLRMFDCVPLLDEETVEGMEHDHGDEEHDEEEHDEEEHDHDHDAHDMEIDEHIWTAPLNAGRMLSAINEEFKALRPDDAEKCDRACAEIMDELNALDAEARDIAENCPKHTLVFADRFPFRYLTHAYGWDYYAAFSGCSSDTDASAATLSFLIQKVRDENIQTVFYLENSSQKISDAVCKATGAKAVMLQSCNNVSKADFQSRKHYQDFMRENLAAIREALS